MQVYAENLMGFFRERDKFQYQYVRVSSDSSNLKVSEKI